MMNATSVCVTQHLFITNGGLAQERLNLMGIFTSKTGVSSWYIINNSNDKLAYWQRKW